MQIVQRIFEMPALASVSTERAKGAHVTSDKEVRTQDGKERTGLGQFSWVKVVYKTPENSINPNSHILTWLQSRQAKWEKNVSGKSVLKFEPIFYLVTNEVHSGEKPKRI